MKRRWKEDCEGLLGLKDVRFMRVPMRRSRNGPTVDLKPLVLERLAARALVCSEGPIRGREVRVLRAALELSLEKFARKLGLTSGTIYRWERAHAERLSSVNEVAVRLLLAEELGIELPTKFSKLIGRNDVTITVQVS